jgi:hypothetical protein
LELRRQEEDQEDHEVDIIDASSSVFDEKETSKTFRKRRLTLTMHNPHMPTEADFEVALNDTVEAEGGEEGRGLKRRRMSDVSHASTASASTVGSMSGLGYIMQEKLSVTIILPSAPTPTRTDSIRALEIWNSIGLKRNNPFGSDA